MGRAQTKPRAATAQFSFDFAAPTPLAQPGRAHTPRRDPLAERLIAAGLATHDAVLTINRALSVPDRSGMPTPWNLPSRLFQSPIGYEPGTPDEPGRLHLRHLALAEHPGVQAIRAQIPEPEHWDDTLAPDGILTWNHAVDLMTPRLWPMLIATRRFVDDDMIATALAFALLSPGLTRGTREKWTLALARSVMGHLNAPEPADRSRALIAGDGLWPARIESHVAPNIRPRGAAAAWLTIHGIEDGYLAYAKSGWLGVTPKGLALRAEQR